MLFPEVWESVGAEFLWSSECYNDDVPYWLDLPQEKHLPDDEKKGMLLIPYNYDCNDGKFHMSPGFGSSVAETYENYLKNTFDCLYREGGKMMNIPLHTRIIGKPGRSEALRKFSMYILVLSLRFSQSSGLPLLETTTRTSDSEAVKFHAYEALLHWHWNTA